MSLISCIKKAGEYLDPQDKTNILNRARELRADGLTAKEAGIQAVDEVLESIQSELSAMEEGGIGDNILASVSDLPASIAPPFYSALRRHIEGLNINATQAGGWRDAIKGAINQGKIKEDEVEWTGIREWLDLQEGKITKQQVTDYLDANGVQVEEVTLGDRSTMIGTLENQLSEWAIEQESSGKKTALTDAILSGASSEETLRTAKRVGAQQSIIDLAKKYDDALREVGVTKYSQYTLPGGENYREVLLTLPENSAPAYTDQNTKPLPDSDPAVVDSNRFWYVKTPDNVFQIAKSRYPTIEDAIDYVIVSKQPEKKTKYKSSHWDQANVLAHIRLNDRTDADGKRVLFVEEIQSDWGQDGKKKGFGKPEIAPSKSNIGWWDVAGESFSSKAMAEDAADRKQGLPTAPFVTATDKWLTLALKRVITMAAQEGYDRVAFVNGEQSADRYDLSQQIDRLQIVKSPTGTYTIGMFKNERDGEENLLQSHRDIPAENLEDYVGKQIAKQAIDGQKDFSGDGLKVGGEGMKAFYDKIVPNAANALLKKLGGNPVSMWGASVLPSNNQFAITPEMREKAAGGLPLFAQPSRPLMNFRKLTGNASASTAKADAEAVLGMPSPVPVLTEANYELAENRVPMWYDLNKKAIYYNTAYKGHDRARDAQWMTEEIMHAVDHIDGTATISASSETLRKGGELRTELEAAVKRGGALYDILRYPLDMQDKFTEDRIVAELFARTAVVYNGFPDLLRAAAPKTYEVFHGFFQRRNEAVRSQARRDSAVRGEESGGLGADRAGSQRTDGAGQTSEKLARFRDEIAAGIGGKREGRRANFGGLTLSSSQASGNQGGRSADDTTKGSDEATGLPVNSDGTVTVYHHTSKANANAIRKTGTLKAQAEPDVYVTTHRETNTGYGDTAVPIRVKPGQLTIDDEFPNGRKDFRLNVGKPGGTIKVAVENEPTAPKVPRTGEPVTLYFNRNTESSKRMAPAGMDFGQQIEPVGEYMNVEQSIKLTSPTGKWESGRITFKNPLVLEHKSTDSTGWKRDVSQMFGGKTGAKLTDAIKKAGYDAIITHDKYGLSETVNLGGTKSEPTAPDSDGAPIAQTETLAFKKWFGDSKVVDAQGKPLVVYHGTAADFDSFDSAKTGANDRGQWGRGHYFAANPEGANSYALRQGDGARVIPAYVSIKNPLVLRTGSDLVIRLPDGTNTRDLIGQNLDGSKIKAVALDGGHDGVIQMKPDGSIGDVVAFNPTQIKSATGNSGNFDGSNPSILATVNTPTKRAARSLWFDETGRLQFAPGAAVNQWLADGIVGKALSRAMLRTASPAMRKQLRAMKLAVQDAQDKAVEVAKAAQAMSTQELAMVSDVIEQELSSGTVPPAEVLRMAAVMDTAMAQQTKELVSLGMLTAETAARWDGKYLPRYYGKSLGKTVEAAWEKAARMLTRKPSALTGIKGKHLKGRGMYANASANEVQDWLDLGYEIRDADLDASIKTAADVQGLIKSGDLKPRDEVQVWRDFTRAERDDMGEIRDASLRFTLGYMETQRDIALGRMFEAMASDPELSSKTATEKHTERVPDGTLEGSGAKRYGKLSGRYISRDDFSQLDNATGIESEMFKVYKEGLAKWKEGKTVLNPVAHFNNIVSNMSMAHFAGVSYWDTHKYIGALHDFATSAPKIKEARDAGLFLGTVSDEELRNMLPEELRKLVVQTESYGRKAGRFAFNVMALGLRKPLGAAYQAEDLFYRYLIWKDATNRGLDPEDAVDYAQKFIFDYSDLPKTARAIRDFGIPFFSYTYKFIPAFVSTALTHPTRLAAPAAVLWGLQAMAYGLLASGDEEDEGVLETIWQSVTDPVRRERAMELAKEEGQNLPKWMKGATSIGTPRAIRLKNDESTGLPMFIDVSRIVPGGDIFDVHANAGGVPMLQWLTPNNPLLTTFGAMFLNRDSFTGKDIVDKEIDTDMEAAKKRSGWMWKQLTPAIAAGNYHWERTMQAAATANGGELPAWVPDLLGGDSTGVGRDGVAVTPGRAALNTVGIKIRPIDLDRSEQINESQKARLLREIEARVRSLQRQHKSGAISDRTIDKEKDIAAEKKDRLRDGKNVDGDEK